MESPQQQIECERSRRDFLMIAAAGTTALLAAGMDDIERLLTKILYPEKYKEIMQKNNGRFPPALAD